MAPIDPTGAREFLEAVIAGFAVLGGVMAYFSGYAAHRALANNEPSYIVANSIDEGIGDGFEVGTGSDSGTYDHGMDVVNRFLRSPHSALVVGTVTSALVGLAVFVLGAPPIILIPAILIVGTAHFELKSRAIHRFDRH